MHVRDQHNQIQIKERSPWYWNLGSCRAWFLGRTQWAKITRKRTALDSLWRNEGTFIALFLLCLGKFVSEFIKSLHSVSFLSLIVDHFSLISFVFFLLHCTIARFTMIIFRFSFARTGTKNYYLSCLYPETSLIARLKSCWEKTSIYFPLSPSMLN